MYRLTATSEGYFKDRGSKFLAFAFSVYTKEEIDLHLQSIRKKYHDARHHCYAYRLGKTGDIAVANDDGEPSHSAGDPILAAIRSAELTDILVVVVRYFGGTKLGIRGLIEAYRSATEDAIAHNQKAEIIPKVQFTLHFSYPQTAEINRILHRFETEVLEANYTDSCKQRLSIKESSFKALENQLVLAGFSIVDIAQSS